MSLLEFKRAFQKHIVDLNTRHFLKSKLFHSQQIKNYVLESMIFLIKISVNR